MTDAKTVHTKMQWATKTITTVKTGIKHHSNNQKFTDISYAYLCRGLEPKLNSRLDA